MVERRKQQGKRVRSNPDGQPLVDRSEIEFSISNKNAKKKLKISEQAKSRISTSRTSELAARRTAKDTAIRKNIWGRTDPNKPAPAKRFNGNMLWVTLTAGACTMLLLGPLANFIKQSQSVDDLTGQVQQAQLKFQSAQEVNKKWQDPEFVKQQARSRLFYTMPGETNYVSVGDTAQKNEELSGETGNSATPLSSSTNAKEQQAQAAKWYDSFVKSYNSASNGK